jgi:hypothetical protein
VVADKPTLCACLKSDRVVQSPWLCQEGIALGSSAADALKLYLAVNKGIQSGNEWLVQLRVSLGTSKVIELHRDGVKKDAVDALAAKGADSVTVKVESTTSVFYILFNQHKNSSIFDVTPLAAPAAPLAVSMLAPAPPAAAAASSEDMTKCGVCCANSKNIALVPCGHIFYCCQCYELSKATTSKCPICCVPIKSTLQIFL